VRNVEAAVLRRISQHCEHLQPSVQFAPCFSVWQLHIMLQAVPHRWAIGGQHHTTNASACLTRSERSGLIARVLAHTDSRVSTAKYKKTTKRIGELQPTYYKDLYYAARAAETSTRPRYVKESTSFTRTPYPRL
jgi:hypothetical protein